MSHPRSRRTLAGVLALPLTLGLGIGLAVAQAPGDTVDRPEVFTSTITVDVDAEQVAGESGDATGTYVLELNSDEDIVCFDITISDADDTPESPAPTANHIHVAPEGEAGPPIWAFPNPEMNADGDLVTQGCLQASYIGDTDDTLADVEADPAGFYVDYHSATFPGGEVRGQLTDLALVADEDDAVEDEVDPIPAEGGVPAGGEGGPATSSLSPLALSAGLLLLGGVAFAVRGRRVAA